MVEGSSLAFPLSCGGEEAAFVLALMLIQLRGGEAAPPDPLSPSCKNRRCWQKPFQLNLMPYVILYQKTNMRSLAFTFRNDRASSTFRNDMRENRLHIFVLLWVGVGGCTTFTLLSHVLLFWKDRRCPNFRNAMKEKGCV